MCSGYALRPEEILNKTFAVSNTEMIVLNNIEFVSMCEHHLLPFRGVCHIGYLPKTCVLGLSKLARLTELYARRLQIQEEMTYQIGSALMKHLNPLGVGVLITAEHMCMSCRGINKQNAVMVTSSMLAGITREKASELIKSRCDFALQRHLVFTATAMEALARHLKQEQDIEFWYVTGLLHDIDWNQTIDCMEKHCGEETMDYLRSHGAAEEVCQTIRSHYTDLNVPRDSLHRKALFACDELSGFIVAAALVRPTKMIGIEPSSVIKKMKDKAFARQVNRDDMQSCEEYFNIPLKEFIAILLPAFERIAPDWQLT
ncbi:hypothetical protein CHS0354_027408 [Potamilus streckersoni]|uniref:GTP cyclohydrolase 1 n=1 Tax=Potamilus streckersoni TaxID=2493646 RepID=A0AAE0SRC1_9BIVA|nr:hypothetical protein CHS0354_027408 [Potamilus streckersoni]